MSAVYNITLYLLKNATISHWLSLCNYMIHCARYAGWQWHPVEICWGRVGLQMLWKYTLKTYGYMWW